MNRIIDNRGSFWRIWDLHVHSPQTYGGDYNTFISNLSNSPAEVIGINDYCSIQGYKQTIANGGVTDKVLFPVVELRMHNLLNTKKNPHGVRINFHIIFDNNPYLLQTIETWLNSLKCFDEKGNSIQLGVSSDLAKVSFDFEKVIESLKEFELYENHSLIWLPYDEYGGIDEIDPINDGFFKLSLINKAHIIGSSTKKQIDFFNWSDDKYSIEQYKKWFDSPKPCIKGSDAHKINYPFGKLQNARSEPIDKYCWINADATFQGLKQIIIEPGRVCIADEPDLLKRVKSNQTKFIKSLKIRQISNTTIDDIWFDNLQIDLNSSLVAIIGNKGSGKSALTDVVSLCGNTHHDPNNFSFLTSNKFRKPKPYNLSEKFEAQLFWQDGTSLQKRLNENPDKTFPQRVKYIPQNFLEKLCGNVESDDFEKELKNIIYSHTPHEKRFGKSSLDDLISYKSNLVNIEISQIQVQIGKLNQEIISLERKATKQYRITIENQLKLKQEELITHGSNVPKQPILPKETEDTKRQNSILANLREEITKHELRIEQLKVVKNRLTIDIEELKQSIQHFKNIEESLKKSLNSSHPQIVPLVKNNINIPEIISYNIDTSQLSRLVDEKSTSLFKIENSLNPNYNQGEAYNLKVLNERLEKEKEALNKSASDQQKYLDSLRAWEAKKKEIEGNSETEGTFEFLKAHLDYLKNELGKELKYKIDQRNILATDLYNKKLSLIETRKDLFQPVTQFINDFKELKERYDVKIDVILELRAFSDNFFNFLNQGRVGTFCGKEEGYKKLLEIIEKADFESSKGFIDFLNEILENLMHDKRTEENTELDIESQLKKGFEVHHLYDFLFNGDFLQPVYNLKLGNKTLQELSPGERGALLLIFYLILDNDDIPLIIDQPEENLDNESVYYILVHFIKKVKEKRQIIIVTHNPNLAIVCDADQIINIQIEKENKNKVKIQSGAIENDEINKAIINILEGTLPAFNNRKSKYIQ